MAPRFGPCPGTMNVATSDPAASASPAPFRRVRGLTSRVVASIGIVFGGAIVLLLYLGFLASSLAWYSNVVVVLVIFLGGIGALAALWASWGMRMFRENAERCSGTVVRTPPQG